VQAMRRKTRRRAALREAWMLLTSIVR